MMVSQHERTMIERQAKENSRTENYQERKKEKNQENTKGVFTGSNRDSQEGAEIEGGLNKGAGAFNQMQEEQTKEQ